MTKRKNPDRMISEDKLELAARIAKQSKKVAHTYESIESSFLRIIRWLSSWVDRFLFNQKYSKIVAFLLAVMLYVVVNISNSPLGAITQSGFVINEIPITVRVNEEVYEVSGLPNSVSASIIGDVSDISMLKNSSSYKVVADLTGLGEGTHEVDLAAADFSSRLNVSISPSKAVVTIKKKVTWRFNLSYDYINTDGIDAMYLLGTPTLSTTEVMVKASQTTIDQVAFVKALIDVKGQSATFTTEAKLVAYDANGNRINVDLIPSIVTATVPVSSPNKTVAILIEPIGEIPNNMAIDRISLDHASVTLYGPDSVISKINNIKVQIDATTITENSSYTAPITVPSGVNKASVSRVILSVTLGEKVSREILNIPINVYNNTNGYKFSLGEQEDAVANVIVYGTSSNISALTTEDIDVFFSMQNIQPGRQEIQLSITGKNPLVKYEIVQPIITLTVID
ncbi:MAG: CdaR family protein [Erysipelotrichaceae bacterium]|nr:CdaR family protein [Erysipelotrichaceae bacterium]